MTPPTPLNSSVVPMSSGATTCTLRAKKVRRSRGGFGITLIVCGGSFGPDHGPWCKRCRCPSMPGCEQNVVDYDKNFYIDFRSRFAHKGLSLAHEGRF